MARFPYHSFQSLHYPSQFSHYLLLRCTSCLSFNPLRFLLRSLIFNQLSHIISWMPLNASKAAFSPENPSKIMSRNSLSSAQPIIPTLSAVYHILLRALLFQAYSCLFSACHYHICDLHRICDLRLCCRVTHCHLPCFQQDHKYS